MSLLKKILIANRGEIACRIMRTAKRMGIQTVAIHSDIDRNSKFVSMADQAYRVGPNPSLQSYLNSKKILEIALQSKCQGLHPGFGFLSENASFAQECFKSGINFIGPPSKAITSMGSKSESKKIMSAANVPVVPGYHQDNQDPHYLESQTEKIGYPVLIKAVSGGGGKGMRIVRNRSQFQQSLESCKRESMKAFKDDRVIIEKYITKPRHIEVQVFGDQFGNYVHLFQRDCSIQRRHQKVVEQAPSNISQEIRKSICQSAVNAAKAVGYYNAGTVEFIFDLDSKKHYFMEMNTRLQVQHPISEMITGFDFVEWQLLVASKFPLPKKQHQIQKKGNAIEVRVYSEDPFNGFLPSDGTLQYFREPLERGNNIRIQTGVREKDLISPYYDPMIAKLITYGKDRKEAIEFMKKALSEYRVVGLPNNLKFLKRVIADKQFQLGDYDTGYIERNIATLLKKQKEVSPFSIVSAVIARYYEKSKLIQLPPQLINYRNVRGQPHKHVLALQNTSFEKKMEFECSIQTYDSRSGTVILNKHKYAYEFQPLSSNVLNITINGQIRKLEYFNQNNNLYLFDVQGNEIGFQFKTDELKEVIGGQEIESNIRSPIAGIISKIFVKAGSKVLKGDPLFAIEAMKMEHIVKAKSDCTVAKILAHQKQFVKVGFVSVEVKI